MNKLLFRLLVACLTTPVNAALPPTEKEFLVLSPESQAREAVGVLQVPTTKGDIWALGGVGIAGARPLKFLAYQALLNRGDASKPFIELLKSPDAQTQLYALQGLSVCDPDTFRRVAPAFTHRTDPVLTGRGCILATIPFGQLVKDRLVVFEALTPKPIP